MCFGAVIVEDDVGSEIYSRLNNERDYPFPCRSQPSLREGPLKGFQGSMNMLGLCYCGAMGAERLSARRRNLASDDIDDPRSARRQFPMRLLRNLA